MAINVFTWFFKTVVLKIFIATFIIGCLHEITTTLLAILTSWDLFLTIPHVATHAKVHILKRSFQYITTAIVCMCVVVLFIYVLVYKKLARVRKYKRVLFQPESNKSFSWLPITIALVRYSIVPLGFTLTRIIFYIILYNGGCLSILAIDVNSSDASSDFTSQICFMASLVFLFVISIFIVRILEYCNYIDDIIGQVTGYCLKFTLALLFVKFVSYEGYDYIEQVHLQSNNHTEELCNESTSHYQYFRFVQVSAFAAITGYCPGLYSRYETWKRMKPLEKSVKRENNDEQVISSNAGNVQNICDNSVSPEQVVDPIQKCCSNAVQKCCSNAGNVQNICDNSVSPEQVVDAMHSSNAGNVQNICDNSLSPEQAEHVDAIQKCCSNAVQKCCSNAGNVQNICDNSVSHDHFVNDVQFHENIPLVRDPDEACCRKQLLMLKTCFIKACRAKTLFNVTGILAVFILMPFLLVIDFWPNIATTQPFPTILKSILRTMIYILLTIVSKCALWVIEHENKEDFRKYRSGREKETYQKERKWILKQNSDFNIMFISFYPLLAHVGLSLSASCVKMFEESHWFNILPIVLSQLFNIVQIFTQLNLARLIVILHEQEKFDLEYQQFVGFGCFSLMISNALIPFDTIYTMSHLKLTPTPLLSMMGDLAYAVYIYFTIPFVYLYRSCSLFVFGRYWYKSCCRKDTEVGYDILRDPNMEMHDIPRSSSQVV